MKTRLESFIDFDAYRAAGGYQLVEALQAGRANKEGLMPSWAKQTAGLGRGISHRALLEIVG